MARTRFLETDTKTFEELLGNGRLYEVPTYQRDYSWEREQWEDLWLDIVDPSEAGLPHYMGSLVFQNFGRTLRVIDGQQRLATLSMLCIAIIERLAALKTPENIERAALLKAQYVGVKDPASLRMASKLTLNETDKDFFQETIVNQKALLSPPSKLRSSHRRLWQAMEYFRDKLGETIPAQQGGEALVQFFQNAVAQRLHFTEIVVEDELNAYMVFETLNARSLRLTSTDLLKNYLLSLFKAGDVDLNQARAQWNRITQIIDLDEMPTFLRHFLASRRALVRAERLFKVIKQEVRSREAAFTLLDDLERAASWYRALEDPNDETWSGGLHECRGHLKELRLFDVRQFKPLALALLAAKFEAGQVIRVLRACAVISFRYNVIGKRNPNQMEEVYNRAAMAVAQGSARTASDVIGALRALYVEDEDFVVDFARAEAPTLGRKAKLAKYVLFALERQLGGTGLDFETASETIEHVLPENPGPAWAEEFGDEDLARFVNRIGNLTILARGANRDLGNSDFQTKRAVYERSGFKLTEGIADDTWSPDTVMKRQAEMARVAKTVWQVSFPEVTASGPG